MGYAYEDDDLEEKITEINENLVEVKNEKTVNTLESNGEPSNNQGISEENSKFIVNNLLVSEEQPKEETQEEHAVYYNKDDLLKDEKEYNKDDNLYLGSLITKKDQKYFDAALGKRGKGITKKKFNIFALLFGGIYFIYRGVFLIGIVALVIDLLATILFPIAKVKNIVLVIFLVGIHIYYGINANMIILNDIASKILNLKVKHVDNIEEVLRKGKKTYILFAILAMFIYSFVICITSYSNILSIVNTLKYYVTGIKVEEKNTFDGTITPDTSVDIESLVTIEVPQIFESNTSEKYYYYFNYYDENSEDNYIPKCTIELSTTTEYDNYEDLINDIAEYYVEDKDNIITTEVNGYKWSSIKTSLSSKDIIYASTTINNKIYVLKYIYYYYMEDECATSYDEVLSSIKDNT